MKIRKTSTITGITRSIEIPVDPVHYASYTRGYDIIENLMPYLSDEHRLFIETGVTTEEWETAIRKEREVYDNIS